MADEQPRGGWRDPRRRDLLRSVTVVVFLSLIVYLVVSAPDQSHRDLATIGTFTGAVMVGLGYVWGLLDGRDRP